MKTLVSYLFWKNVYHVRWLYWTAVIYLFIMTKDMRQQVSLAHGIARVEAQDQHRVYMIEFNRRLNELLTTLRDITQHMAYIQSLLTIIDHENSNQ